MAKWADYLISAAKYDSKKRLVKVMQHADTGGDIGGGQLVDRDTLSANLKKGASYCTIFGGNASWSIGDAVRFVKVGGDHSIRTDSNKVCHDNLKSISELE